MLRKGWNRMVKLQPNCCNRLWMWAFSISSLSHASQFHYCLEGSWHLSWKLLVTYAIVKRFPTPNIFLQKYLLILVLTKQQRYLPVMSQRPHININSCGVRSWGALRNTSKKVWTPQTHKTSFSFEKRLLCKNCYSLSTPTRLQWMLCGALVVIKKSFPSTEGDV